jgi:hypothetical protein
VVFDDFWGDGGNLGGRHGGISILACYFCNPEA